MKTAGLYASIILTTLAWWYCAFKPTSQSTENQNHTPFQSSTSSFQPPRYLSNLSPMQRDLIQQALSGDVELMTTLIGEWDIDAQIMERNGLVGVKRLPRSTYLKAQILNRQLKDSTEHEISQLRSAYSQKAVMDDNEIELFPQIQNSRFLPQTYVSASFLLALNDPEEIVAIPHGLREETNLYPQELTDQIPYDVDRYQSEKLYQEKPSIAFVAHYSHPTTLEALRNQGVQLFMLKGQLNNVFEISDALTRIGKLVNRPIKSELLSIFMESAMIAIDNRMFALNQTMVKDKPSRVMFLHYFTHYSMPTGKTITGQLMKRLQPYHFSFISEVLENEEQWLIPVDHEKILDYDPDCLIIASSCEGGMKNHIQNDSSFHHLKAAKNQQIYFVDSSIQQSPTQYIVLAYYDLANTLSHTQNP